MFRSHFLSHTTPLPETLRHAIRSTSVHPMTYLTLSCAAPFSLFILCLVSWCAFWLQFCIKVRVAALWSHPWSPSCTRLWWGHWISCRDAASLIYRGGNERLNLSWYWVRVLLLSFLEGSEGVSFLSEAFVWYLIDLRKKIWGTCSRGLGLLWMSIVLLIIHVGSL